MLEVNYTEDDLLDAASDNQGNFNILTDELSFNLDSIILRPKPFTSDEADEDSGEEGDKSDNDSQASRNSKDGSD